MIFENNQTKNDQNKIIKLFTTNISIKDITQHDRSKSNKPESKNR